MAVRVLIICTLSGRPIVGETDSFSPPTGRVAKPFSARSLSPTVRRCFDQGVSIVLSEPGVDGLSEAVRVLRGWQCDGAPVQLHPGDLGWYWRFGAEATAAAVRTWSREGQILAVGLLDGPGLLRVAIAPEAQHDEELAQQMAADVTQPERDVLPAGKVSIEARFGALFRGLLFDDGWDADEPWTPLCRDLAEPVEDCGVPIEVIGPQRAHVRAAVQRAAFERSTFTEERWQAMAAGLPYADARCLVAYADQDTAVAAATVWSAGPGRPGLLEPMGVHREHRGHGYGTAITVAAAAALRELGSSSATVCTASSNVGAVATYKSAGFQQSPEVRDLHRSA
jgi:ribosomal protein S18 acetylase RimI-like enzyme